MLPFTFHGVLLDVVEVLGMFLEGRHGPTLYRSISLSCKPQAADTAGLRKPSDKDLRSLELWPRVEQRKWILAKKRKQKPNHQKNNSAGRVTRKIKKQTRKKQTKKKQKKQIKTCIFLSFLFFFVSLVGVLFFFAFFLFFLGFGFLVCFFCLLCFFVKPYILCVAGLITLEHRAATTLSWFTVCTYPNFRQPHKIPKTSSDPDMATDLFARRVDRNSRKDIPGRNHLNFINSSRGVHVAFTWRLAIGRPHMPLPLLRRKAVRVREVPAQRSRCHCMTGWWYTYNVRPPR